MARFLPYVLKNLWRHRMRTMLTLEIAESLDEFVPGVFVRAP